MSTTAGPLPTPPSAVRGGVESLREKSFWLLLLGIVLAALGILLWAKWPVSGLFAIGLFLGIQMIFTGAGFVALAISVRSR